MAHNPHHPKGRSRQYASLHHTLALTLGMAVICFTFLQLLRGEEWLGFERLRHDSAALRFPLQVPESDLKEYQRIRSFLGCNQSKIFDCLDKLREFQESVKAPTEAKVKEAPTFKIFDSIDTRDLDKKRAHEVYSVEYAIQLARERMAQLQDIYPSQGPYPDEIPILTPVLSEELKAKPEWRDLLFPDLNVAGLHKCGTSQLTHIIISHPKVRKFRKEGMELFFKHDYLFDSIANSKEEQLEFQTNLHEFHKNLYNEQMELIGDNDETKSQLTVASTLVVDDAVLRSRFLQSKKPTRFFILTRDPADWLWAAWNFWLDSELDSKPAEWPKRGWASQKLQYRSPELFHELLLGADRVKSHSWFHRLRDAAVNSPRRYIAAFGKDNIFFARNEDMLPVYVDSKGGLLDRLSNFTGLDREGFRASVAKQIHNCNDVKGNEEVCNKTSSSYSIAGGRPMLPESRRLVYLFFATECKLWKEEFGIEYPECLNALPSNEEEKSFVQRN